ncbi:hypothetical protein WJX77_007902 [Trebouxia sp. C0004]
MDPHIDAMLKRFAAVLSPLLSAGADLEAVDDEGLTPLHTAGQSPLHVAASRESPETLRLLLSQGADPNAVNTSGFKVLLVTVRAIKNAESVSLLLAPDPAVQDNQVYTLRQQRL